MEKKFKGIFSALVTPFNSDGTINVSQLEKITEYEIAKLKVDGLYVCGSTGEAFLLDYQERSLVMKVVADVKKRLNSNVSLIAQVGGLNVYDMEKLIHDAERYGYDGLSAVTPFYYGFKFDDVKKYYEFATSISDLPMLIYYLPALTAININFDNFIELLEMKNVAGAKYSSPDLFMLERLISKKPDKVFLFGVDEFLMAATTLGIDGAIGSTYNLLGNKAKAIFELTKQNRISEARKLTTEYNIYLKFLLDGGIYQTLKQATAYACNAGETHCRLPLGKIDEKAKKIAKELANKVAV